MHSVTSGAASATAADELPLPLEYLAVYKELLLAYKLLEVDSGMKVWEAVHCATLKMLHVWCGQT